MTGSRFSFLRRVRIHDGECGAVARALHHEAKIISLPAATEKVSLATQERKVMSKKTFFKRIAISAIAALGFGMLSVVPSQASVESHTLTIDNAADAIETGDTATAVLSHSFLNLDSALDSVVVRAIVTSSNASTAGTLRMTISDSSTNVAGSVDEPNYGYTGAPTVNSHAVLAAGDYGTAIDSFTVYNDTPNRVNNTTVNLNLVRPTAAGTYTVSVFTQRSNVGGAPVTATPAATWTVTVTAPVVAAATTASTVTLRNGNVAAAGGTYFGGTAEGTDSQTLAARVTSTTTTTPSFQLVVKLKDGAAINTARESYTVTATGEAYVSAGTDASGNYTSSITRPTATSSTAQKSIRMATAVADTASIVNVWSTGTAGTATITVTTDGGVLIGTKTVTFAGPITKLEVTRTTNKVIQAGTATATTGAFRVTATDAGGRAVPSSTLSLAIVSSNVSAISGGSCSDLSGAVTDGVYSCDINPVVTSTSGMAATLTVRTPDPAVTTATATAGPFISTTYDVTMGGAVSTFVLTTDKATYAPGEAMIVTATAKDASGNTPFDGQAGPTLRANKALGGTAAGSSITMNVYYDGVSTSQTRSTPVRTLLADNTLFAPAASGEFSISGLDGQTVPASVSVKATVGDDAATAAASAATDAALEAIDAANAATDAANLAAEAADAATVAAEEARDAADAATAAVEALATEVATLMAALKAQITTLANTVAKIAKRVRA